MTIKEPKTKPVRAYPADIEWLESIRRHLTVKSGGARVTLADALHYVLVSYQKEESDDDADSKTNNNDRAV